MRPNQSFHRTCRAQNRGQTPIFSSERKSRAAPVISTLGGDKLYAYHSTDESNCFS